MKPAFALSFSSAGISLHHQSDDDWYQIGSVSLDAPDLSDQIRGLRDQAFALENDLSCKVVIPQDQIRYLSVETEGISPEDSEQKVYDALASATPYDLSDLSFDTATEGTTIHIAAMARQTLDEAEAFATEHGFIPVLFSADPDHDDFPHEPHFGADEPPRAVEVTLDEEPVHVVEPAPDEPPHVAETASEEEAPAPAEPEDPLPPVEDTPPVHAIAESADPDTFRSIKPRNAPFQTVFSAAEPKAGRYVLPAIAAAILAGVSLSVWTLFASDEQGTEVASLPVEEAQLEVKTNPEQPDIESNFDSAPAETQQPDEAEAETASLPTPDEQPDLSSTDEAILEALKIPPTTVETVQTDPQTEFAATSEVNVTPPAALELPVPVEADDHYLASVNKPDLSSDAIALPPVESFDTDQPFAQVALPQTADSGFDLDERGLVPPTSEGTLNPDGVMVYAGRPSSVPPEPPVRFEEEPVIDEVDQRLAGLRPKGRPGDLVEQFERQQLGGRSLEELAGVRPKLRPESLQVKPQVDETPTALAVVRVPRPKLRPARAVAAAASSNANTANLGSTAAVGQSSDEAGSFQPKTVKPKAPSTASVARQATIDNALNLRRLNLIGVYGTPANRRALVRLPSGRYKKLKIGDRLDGGKVIAISDSELRYQKKGRNVTLSMPRS